jgi:hypothetical protein
MAVAGTSRPGTVPASRRVRISEMETTLHSIIAGLRADPALPPEAVIEFSWRVLTEETGG